MKKILTLGGSYAQIPFLKALKDRSYYIILVDYLPDNPGQEYADEYYPLSTTDKESLLKLAKEKKPDIVYSYASDPAAPVVAYLNQELGLKSKEEAEAVQVLGEKNLFKNFLKNNGFSVPEFIEYDLSKEAKISDLEQLNYPYILKPTDSSGSKGVSLVKNEDEFEKALFHAKKFSRNSILIAEEFIDTKGQQIHGDVFVEDGEIIFHHLGDHHFDKDSFVPFSTSWPSNKSTLEIEKIVSELQKVINIIGYKNGPMNVEARLYKNKVYLMEMGPRSGGNYVPLVSYYATGFNMIEAIINQFENIPNKTSSNEKKPSCYYVIRSFNPGTLKSVEINQELVTNIKDVFMYKKQGDEIEVFKGANQAIGIVLLQFKSKTELSDFYLKSNHFIKTVVG